MMRIVRSTSSHAAAGGSNEARETQRFGAIQARKGRPFDDDGLSLNPGRGELVTASLNKYRRPTIQKRPSLKSTGKQRTGAPGEPVGVRGVGAGQKNQQLPGRPAWAVWARARRAEMGINNHRPCPGRESDGLIVARKRGNARGAKEPCCKQANIEEEGAA